MSRLTLGVALICLAVCLAVPFVYFTGAVDVDSYKNILLAASLGWFVFATMWISGRREKR